MLCRSVYNNISGVYQYHMKKLHCNCLSAFIKEISPYGQAVNPDKAPETITNAVASLPPEQMFELMKQMKVCLLSIPVFNMVV